MNFEARLTEFADWADARLALLLRPEHEPPVELHQAMRYACLAPGKRLRPVLAMAAAEAVGADPKVVLDAGCAVEMVHCFSLIHDDLPCIDNDDLRRGLPTTHVKFGEAIAVLAGDALFALAFQVLSHHNGEPNRVLQAVKTLSVATGSQGLVGGETADILAESKPADQEMVDFIHHRKTAVLIEASLTIGGLLSGATDEQLGALSGYGKNLGLAFQIADDLLNEVGTEEDLGKAVGTDRERNKATYPGVLGVEASRTEATRLIDLAQKNLGGLFPNPDFLRSLASYVIERRR